MVVPLPLGGLFTAGDGDASLRGVPVEDPLAGVPPVFEVEEGGGEGGMPQAHEYKPLC